MEKLKKEILFFHPPDYKLHKEEIKWKLKVVDKLIELHLIYS
jgi:hypothetical protein